MENKGFDCGAPVNSNAAGLFVKQGLVFVARYIVPLSRKSWKTLKRAEAELVSKAGLKIVSAYEGGADNAAKGKAQGIIDAKAALQAASEVGQPKGSAIYFAVDFDAQAKHMDAIEEYFKGVKSVVGSSYIVGVYGSYSVIEEMYKRKVGERYWQTYAWSRGKFSSHANIFQYDNGPDGQGKSVNGMNVDLDKSFGNEGWWSTIQAAPAPKPAPTPAPAKAAFDAASAQVAITRLGEVYMASKSDGVKKAAHYAADSLRKATGTAVTLEKGFAKDDAQAVISELGKLYMASKDSKVQEAAHYAADALRDAAGIPKQ